MAVLLAALAASLALAGAEASAAERIPPQFLGKWLPDLALCRADPGESHLVIEADRLEFWEASGAVKRVVRRGRSLTVVAEITGEGDVSVEALDFSLSADGARLTDPTGTARYRCPAR